MRKLYNLLFHNKIKVTQFRTKVWSYSDRVQLALLRSGHMYCFWLNLNFGNFWAPLVTVVAKILKECAKNINPSNFFTIWFKVLLTLVTSVYKVTWFWWGFYWFYLCQKFTFSNNFASFLAMYFNFYWIILMEETLLVCLKGLSIWTW